MTTTADELREEVRRRYAESARAVTEGSEGCGCGSGSCCAETDAANFGEALYDAEQRGELPDTAVLASLGCGNPVVVAELGEGETVLDLGSGGGTVCVCNLTEPLGLSQPTVSHHLKKLLDAGLVEREQRGKWAYYSLKRTAVEKLAAVADLKGACC